MRRVREQGHLPSSASIVDETFERLGYRKQLLGPDSVLAQFDHLLHALWVETLRTLERHEQKGYSEGIPREFMREFPKPFTEAEKTVDTLGFRVAVMKLFGELYP